MHYNYWYLLVNINEIFSNGVYGYRSARVSQGNTSSSYAALMHAADIALTCIALQRDVVQVRLSGN